MIARRLWPKPTKEFVHSPSPSGPRCRTTSVMRFRTLIETGLPSTLKMPVIPHMVLRSFARSSDRHRPLSGALGDQLLVRLTPRDQTLEALAKPNCRSEPEVTLGPLGTAD